MEKSYERILDNLLEEYENNPNVDINVLAQTVAEKLGLKINLDELNETNNIIDSIHNAYGDLIDEKEDNGISTESWVKYRILSKSADAGLDEENQIKVIESVTESIETNNNENLEQID